MQLSDNYSSSLSLDILLLSYLFDDHNITFSFIRMLSKSSPVKVLAIMLLSFARDDLYPTYYGIGFSFLAK
jgi:hypothetical protein